MVIDAQSSISSGLSLVKLVPSMSRPILILFVAIVVLLTIPVYWGVHKIVGVFENQLGSLTVIISLFLSLLLVMAIITPVYGFFNNGGDVSTSLNQAYQTYNQTINESIPQIPTINLNVQGGYNG